MYRVLTTGVFKDAKFILRLHSERQYLGVNFESWERFQIFQVKLLLLYISLSATSGLQKVMAPCEL